MLLRPRRFPHKNRQKKRTYPTPSLNYKLNYGQIGLRLLQPSRLFSKQMFRYKAFIKKGSKRSDKTGRKSWFAAFPHFPLTRKGKGARMGKGKGKVKDWVSVLPAGINIVEYKNLRYGRSLHYLKQIRFKLSPKATIVTKYKHVDSLYGKNSKIMFQRRW